MLISHRHKFIFLKTHKTASTSVEAALEPFCTPDGHVPEHRQAEISSDRGYVSGRMGGQTPDDFLRAHAGARMIEGKVGRKVFTTYTKVYTIRNPYDKVVSWFWHVMPEETVTRLSESFDDTRQLFADWLQMRPVLPVDTSIYSASKGVFAAETIRFEQLKQDLPAFGRKIGVDIDMDQLPRWKSGTRGHKDRSFEEYYTPHLRKIIRQKFAFDFKNFGYAA